MSDEHGQTSKADEPQSPREKKFIALLERLANARPFAKLRFQAPLLEQSRRLIAEPGGIEILYRLAPRLDEAGLFYGTDWDDPAALIPGLVNATLELGSKDLVILECLSELRLLAVANGLATHQGISPEQARHFLTQLLALNLNRILGPPNETQRVRLGPLGEAVGKLFHFLMGHIGYGDILGHLIEEIWRILSQRPIQVAHIKAMVSQIAVSLQRGSGDFGEARLGADRLTSALFGPTQGCLDDPGLDEYQSRLAAMDFAGLQQESYGMARAMHDVGLVSDYHAVLLRWLLDNNYEQLVPDVLGVSNTGRDALQSYQDLVHRLISEAIYPETAQTIYGLTMLLERGVLYAAPIAPGLWRQINLQLSSQARAILPPSGLEPRKQLLAGVISLLGQPLGVGQGNNPTCQSARAISMWAYNDPDYLLHLIAQASRYDSILMHFEGRALDSAALPPGLATSFPLDTDPVSMLLVPHLDRIYNEMGRLCAGRGGDPHRWINPELHGWWVGRQFIIAVDVASGNLKEYDEFLQQFYRSYNPLFNDNQPVIHPQPAGIAVTDSGGNFVGWHAVTLIRVALDQESTMRVYFYNPNNDSGQNWGYGVVVSTQGYGERFGEASLPFDQFASRLYIFHDDPVEIDTLSAIPAETIQSVKEMAMTSWAQKRIPATA
ncbi:MAG: hypothetical protein RI601_11370 [Desulfurivibrionaceae bacterium]|nr:hypothetical protein [Desulfurivibrionaceae bacterium]